MKYNELLRRLRPLFKQTDDRQWRIGDLLLEKYPKGTKGVKDQLVKISIDLGVVTYNHLMACRYVAMSWPPEHRNMEAGFMTHKTLSALPDRFELIKSTPTLREAQKMRGWKVQEQVTTLGDSLEVVMKRIRTNCGTAIKKAKKEMPLNETDGVRIGRLRAEIDGRLGELDAILEMDSEREAA